jgi:hypothetical protein
MHGEKEVKENLLEYCIQKEQKAKLIPYLECFLEADDSAGCMKKQGITAESLKACQDDAEAKFNVMAMAPNFSDDFF